MISAETKLICRQPQIVFVGCCVSACSGMELSQETGYQLFKKAEFSDSAVRWAEWCLLTCEVQDMDELCEDDNDDDDDDPTVW